MQVCNEKGIEWRLGGLMLAEESIFAPKDITAVAKERKLKNQCHAKRFCQVCNENARKLTGTTPIDISLLDMPTTSTQLRKERD